MRMCGRVHSPVSKRFKVIVHSWKFSFLFCSLCMLFASVWIEFQCSSGRKIQGKCVIYVCREIRSVANRFPRDVFHCRVPDSTIENLHFCMQIKYVMGVRVGGKRERLRREGNGICDFMTSVTFVPFRFLTSGRGMLCVTHTYLCSYLP